MIRKKKTNPNKQESWLKFQFGINLSQFSIPVHLHFLIQKKEIRSNVFKNKFVAVSK